MSEQESKFDKAWNAPKTQRIVGIMYSLGASVAIVTGKQIGRAHV